MNLLTLSLADLRHQRLANSLHLGLLALGVAMIAALLLIAAQVGSRIEHDAEGVDLVVGAKGSPLQLILSSVYHLDIPTGNIPLAEAEKLSKNPLIASTIPISLGDNARGFRIVGTTPALVAKYGTHLAEGRLWDAPMEVVLGADVVAAGLKIGDDFAGVHGLGASGHVHADHRYTVVGRLAPTGGVADRLIFTSLESVWVVHGAHQHEASATAGAAPAAQVDDEDDDDHDHDQAKVNEAGDPSREITALLVKYRTPLAAATLPRAINGQSALQAAVPAFEMARLLQLFGIGLETLRALAAALILAATLSVFVALYTAMEARQYDLAVLRSLGASRASVMATLWLQALILAVSGTAIGFALGHLAVEVMGRLAGTARSIGLTGASWAAAEGWLLALPLFVASLAALLPALRAYRSDIAAVLSNG